MTLLMDLTGQRFGRLVVVCRAHSEAGRVRWDCLCDCGQRKNAVIASWLRVGDVKSCGCLRRDFITEQDIKRATHGQTRNRMVSREYSTWRGMINRCQNANCKHFKHYGGRGIRVEFGSFEEFLAEVGPKPLGLSIDRINNDGNYAPGNVRWADAKTQRMNQRPERKRRQQIKVKDDDIPRLIAMREAGATFAAIGPHFGIDGRCACWYYHRYKS